MGGFSIVGGLFLPRDRARPEVTPLRVGARVPEDWKLDSWPSESMLFVVPTGGGLSGSATARLASMPESSPKKPPPGAPDLVGGGGGGGLEDRGSSSPSVPNKDDPGFTAGRPDGRRAKGSESPSSSPKRPPPELGGRRRVGATGRSAAPPPSGSAETSSPPNSPEVEVGFGRSGGDGAFGGAGGSSSNKPPAPVPRCVPRAPRLPPVKEGPRMSSPSPKIFDFARRPPDRVDPVREIPLRRSSSSPSPNNPPPESPPVFGRVGGRGAVFPPTGGRD